MLIRCGQDHIRNKVFSHQVAAWWLDANNYLSRETNNPYSMELINQTGVYVAPAVEYLTLLNEGTVLTVSGINPEGYTDKGKVDW